MIVATGRILPSLLSLPVFEETLKTTAEQPLPPPVVNPMFPSPSVARTWPFSPSAVGKLRFANTNCSRVVIPTNLDLPLTVMSPATPRFPPILDPPDTYEYPITVDTPATLRFPPIVDPPDTYEFPATVKDDPGINILVAIATPVPLTTVWIEPELPILRVSVILAVPVTAKLVDPDPIVTVPIVETPTTFKLLTFKLVCTACCLANKAVEPAEIDDPIVLADPITTIDLTVDDVLKVTVEPVEMTELEVLAVPIRTAEDTGLINCVICADVPVGIDRL